ncbi:hypothetical protein [Clavibacter sp. Sh2088]|uniref:hypothetical protein n=1 Tax=Clavibacter sp. Sh2088 TaxID=3397676 RepID=UPI0039DF88A3
MEAQRAPGATPKQGSSLKDMIVLAHVGKNQEVLDQVVVVGSKRDATLENLLTLIEGKNIVDKVMPRVGNILLYEAMETASQTPSASLQVTGADLKQSSTMMQTSYLIDALGSAAELARLLGVNRSQPTQWRAGNETPGPESRRNLLDLYYVVAKALELYPTKAAIDWLNGSNAYLDGARPIDVLKMRGSKDVVQALEVAMA